MDNAGSGQVWKFTDDGDRGNLTGGTGNFAMIDSDAYGAGSSQDTSLVSPVVDLTGVTAPVIRFNQDFNQLGDDTADVDLSIDGGATWTNVLRQETDVRGPKVTEIPIPQAAGQAQVQVRFRYYDASYEWWWEVDNVLIGSQVTCVPVDGGLVVGNVRDKNDNSYVNGATVTSKDRPAEKAVTVATPDDPGLADGFYWIYSTLTGDAPVHRQRRQLRQPDQAGRRRGRLGDRGELPARGRPAVGDADAVERDAPDAQRQGQQVVHGDQHRRRAGRGQVQ